MEVGRSPDLDAFGRGLRHDALPVDDLGGQLSLFQEEPVAVVAGGGLPLQHRCAVVSVDDLSVVFGELGVGLAAQLAFDAPKPLLQAIEAAQRGQGRGGAAAGVRLPGPG
ncbi:hypothetical protein ACFQ0B_80935 [Nonomuraea thailandensis]